MQIARFEEFSIGDCGLIASISIGTSGCILGFFTWFLQVHFVVLVKFKFYMFVRKFGDAVIRVTRVI